MADLSHWDFAEHFSGYDAAALILGVEPRKSENDKGRIRVVTDRMGLHYLNAFNRLYQECPVLDWDLHNIESPRKIELHSVQMKELHSDAWRRRVDVPLVAWLEGPHSSFNHQEFERDAIVGWLRQIGMTSAYPFDRTCESVTESKGKRWPWGEHHTELLGHLEAAAKRFWSAYDPSDTSTANTNATVSGWLQTERKVSRTMADAVASILRADGLPTGPRK